jgi:hypothetical protein
MILGPANILDCPFCGGKKEVMSLASGNTFGATVWSDTRRDYPMLPEVSPIQKCPHCHKYYFVEQARSEYSKTDKSFELGKLTYHELLEAYCQFSELSLTKIQRWILNHEIFLAYNDSFRRTPDILESPSKEDEILYAQIIEELLEGIDLSTDFELFHAELLREISRFEEARAVLLHHKLDEDQWVVDAMIRHIEVGDAEPFLLVKDGEQQF